MGGGKEEGMNVLYLNTHDIGRYLETYGYPVKTPNLLELSKDGMAFTNMYCASPTCSPSRGAMLTGQYPHNNGLIGLSHRGFQIDGSHHMASYFKERGFETVISGVQHEVKLHEEEKLGYERCLNPQEYYRKDMPQCDLYTWQDEMAAENAVSYLKARKAGDRPFFMAVGFGCTHREYPRVPDDYEVDYVQVPKALPNNPEIRRDMAAMMISVNTIDRLCGDIVSALKEAGEYENTVIFFTTDHGLPFPMMKCNLYDDGTGVSFLIRYPGMARRHCVSDALLSHVDVFPTICDIMGMEKPDWLQGKSFLTILDGEEAEINEQVASEINYHVAYEPVRCIRTHRYKYIFRGDNAYDFPPPVHIDDSPAKEVFHTYGYFERANAKEELYDLMLDAQERHNLAGKEEYQSVLEEMRGRLFQWQKDTKDPLLQGTVKLPEGAICCTTDSYSTGSQVMLPECKKYVAALAGVLQNKIDV